MRPTFPFSRIGWALLVHQLAALAAQFILLTLARTAAPQLLRQAGFQWGIIVLSSYGAAFPLFRLALGSGPSVRTPRHPLGPRALAGAWCAAMCLLLVSNLATLFFLDVLETLLGAPVHNPVGQLLSFPPWMTFTLVCVLAPIFEEWMFRALMLARLRPFGPGFALILSSLAFALLHGNLNQFFYTFTTALVLGGVYLRSGCLWQSILLHSLVNLAGSGLLTPYFPVLPALLLLNIPLGVALLTRRRQALTAFLTSPAYPGAWQALCRAPGVLALLLWTALSFLSPILFK
ncbi:CPBP family intramembrane metalloprotease [Pseudoflavonifractor sp. 524-17]|uniref:CPBP family intramembrane glutamic endopeptidase n=1 Tax=Pseudoflavonifractor sp. 524-17 TaxID=2304577 RepID=UPI00137B5FB6|nr:type II CAAX endopeptidase family protein [Pseudoflavonifractor sp. 524-17]NCE66030.1 CPBP family intramembrane metalloprotease [Pseudoflavonifractor sp. 524-17]